MELHLKGKTALITGGTSGIGKEIAKVFVEAHAHVIIIGTNHERGQQAVHEFEAHKQDASQKIMFKSLDVANFTATQESVADLYPSFENIDILVNCAGVTRDKLMIKMTEEDWDQVLDINLKSAFNLTKAVIRQMLKMRYGKIINISSVVGLTGNPGQVNYSASKSGMIGFTQSLAKEVATRNICVNCIAPGFIETKMTDELTQEQKEAILSKIPMNRLGNTKDIANLALFLASSMSDYITGEVIAVDGGMTA